MSQYYVSEDRKENGKSVMRLNLKYDPVGKNLTPEAKEQVVDLATDIWTRRGCSDSRDATRRAIKHVTRDPFED